MARNFPTTPQELDSYVMELISGSIAGQVRQALQEMGASMESNGMDGEVPLVGDGVLSAETTTIPLAEVDGSGQPVRYVQARLSTLARLLDNGGGETPVTENTVAVTASPSQATAGTACEIALTVTSAQQATSIRILRNGTQIATGSGTVLRHTDNWTPASAGTATYQAIVTANGTTKTATASVTVAAKPATKDYYIGWANGTKSAFRAKTAQELVAGATSYSTGAAAYSQQCQDIIFYILFRESNPPTGQLDSSGVVSPITASDFLAGGDCPHDPVVVEGITYKVWATRNTDYPTGNNVITINF